MITVALPTWNSSKILWLALEGLARQMDAPEYEVIVMEDPSDNFAGEDYVMEFSDRIPNLRYIELDKKETLGNKWRMIANEASYDVFALAASDNFSPPKRLRISYDVLQIRHGARNAHPNWFDVAQGYFYNILNGDSATYIKPFQQDTGLWMATHTSNIKSLKGEGPDKGIDGWIRDQVKIINRHYANKIEGGFHTDGYNTISLNRRTYTGPAYHKDKWHNPNPRLVMPEDIYRRLQMLRDDL